ncbi:hypothetical protein F4801DRAFT_600059 [Xylaria longipes]|nr:hypothetical protein F4801DRAFT_600059 [Xylaria longipes]
MDINTAEEEDLNQLGSCLRSPFNPFSLSDADLAEFSCLWDTNDTAHPTEGEPPPQSTVRRDSHGPGLFDACNVAESIDFQSHGNGLVDHQCHTSGLANSSIRAQSGRLLEYSPTPYLSTEQQVAAPGNCALRWPVQGRQPIIEQAWLCSYWLRTLLNWNSNQIFLDSFTTLGIVKSADVKNILLELMYAIAYRIEELMQRFFKDVIASLQNSPSETKNMWGISYALLIVYYSIKKSRHREAKSMGLAPLKLFDQLLYESKVPQSTIAIAFEFPPEFLFGFNQPTFYSRTCVDILEAKINFLEDNRLFGIPDVVSDYPSLQARTFKASQRGHRAVDMIAEFDQRFKNAWSQVGWTQ